MSEVKSTDIAVEEWLQELEKLQASTQTRPTGAFTSRELAEFSGKGGDYVRKMIGKAIASRLQGPFKPPGGRLVHFLHHIGTTSSTAHEASAVNGELSAMYVEAGRFGDEPPAIIVRSHRHRYIKVQLAAEGGEASAVVTPGWQLKTPFAWKIAGARTPR